MSDVCQTGSVQCARHPVLNRPPLEPQLQHTRVDSVCSAPCLHQLIEEQVDTTPDKVAVEFEGKRLTYRELDARANQLAHFLKSRGAAPEVLVAVCIERSLDMIVALLGILKSGAAYVPLDTQFPHERLKYMLEDCRPAILLTEASLHPLCNELGLALPTIYLDEQWLQISSESQMRPLAASQPANLAYVIYTSGSTGRPKGVTLTHRSVVNFMQSMQVEPRITSSDVLLAVTTISFDIAALELFLPLSVGATIVIASRAAAKASSSLARLIAAHSITIMQAAPTSWRLLVDSGWPGKPDLKILCGGEALSRDLANELVPRCAALWNMYGPTETTIWSTVHLVTRGNGPVSLGRPIADTQIYILGPDLQPVAPGEIGELYIGGEGLARGYLNKPELTAERFIPNPIANQPSDRIYRTGDLARYLPSGLIQYEGRVDHQIKIHGVRVEPEEIEAAILQFHGIKQALVIARDDPAGDKRLIAYLILDVQNGFQATALRNFLASKLPQYLIPSTFVPLPEFPLTFNGKIDRKSLPEPAAPATRTVTVAEGPQDEIEYSLVSIWQDVLRVRPIGVRDNFFDLGGHSLMAARLLARIEQSLGKELPLASLLDAPTIQQQADLIRGHRNGASQAASNGSGDIPLFYLGGDPTFQPLAQRLGALHTFKSLGIQASIGHRLHNPHSLPSIAEHFVEAIRERRPKGPYMLAGWCAHGLLAFETAQQLRRDGQDVALVVMLETLNPLALRQLPRFTRAANRLQLKWHLLEFERSYLRTFSRERAFDYVSGRLTRKLADLRRHFHNGNHNGTDQLDLDEQNLLEILYGAASHYVPQPYDGPVAVIYSRKRLHGFANERTLGWNKSLYPNMQFIETEGNHYTMYIQPNVDGLAQRMAIQLKSAQTRWEQPRVHQL